MSVPALDSLLEPERGSSKVQPTTSSGMDRERVLVQNRSMPFYPSYPYSTQPTPSPTRPRTPSPSSFSPSPYVLNFKRRVSGSSTSNGKSVAPISDISPAATSQQTTISGAHDGSSSSSSSSSSAQPKNDAAINSVSRENSASTMLRQKNKTVNGKITVSDEGLLPVRGIRDRLRVAGKILDGQDGFQARSNGRKFTVKVDANGDGIWNDESGKWVRSNSSSRPLSHQDSGAPSHLPLNGEEFFDAPEAPLDGKSCNNYSVSIHTLLHDISIWVLVFVRRMGEVSHNIHTLYEYKESDSFVSWEVLHCNPCSDVQVHKQGSERRQAMKSALSVSSVLSRKRLLIGRLISTRSDGL